MWSRQGKIVADDGVADDCFGVSVSLYSTDAFIGSFADDDKGFESGILKMLIIYMCLYVCMYVD